MILFSCVYVERPTSGYEAQGMDRIHRVIFRNARASHGLNRERSDFSMSSGNRTGWSGAASVLLRSYAVDLRSWMAGIAVGYAIGVALVVGGVLIALAGVAVGVIALRFGPELAYAIVGGGFLVLGLVLLLAGMAVIRRRLPSPPSPRRQAGAVRQVIIRPAALRMAAGFDIARSVRTDLTTHMMAGAAATLLLAWIVASRRQVRR